MEIYQNCNIFNDRAFASMTDKETKSDTVLWLKNGEPMLFGTEQQNGVRLDGNTPIVVEIGDEWGVEDVLVHDESDYVIASLLSNMTYQDDFPDPIGVLYAVQEETYEERMMVQLEAAQEKRLSGSIKDILNSGDIWTVK